VDNSGYEYRTNTQSFVNIPQPPPVQQQRPYFNFNFNSFNGVTFSDIVVIPISRDSDTEFGIPDPTEAFLAVDVDIFDNAENVFSCRDVIFACINQESPRQKELLSFVGDDDDDIFGFPSSASVADFEYGINNAIPNSKGGELLCPGNTIPEGHVKLTFEESSESQAFAGYLGLNNGNGRGSMDSFWVQNYRSPVEIEGN